MGSLVQTLIRSHCSLIRSLQIARVARTLRCAYSLTCLWNECVDSIQSQPTVHYSGRSGRSHHCSHCWHRSHFHSYSNLIATINFLICIPFHLHKFVNGCFLDAFSHLYNRVCPSVGPSVSPSVCQSVRPSVRHTLPFWGFCGFWPHSSCPNDLVTSIMAPAHPHATGVAVYPALFLLTRDIYLDLTKIWLKWIFISR